VICGRLDSFFWNEMELFRERVATVTARCRRRGDDSTDAVSAAT